MLKNATFKFTGTYDTKAHPTVTAGSSTITNAQIDSLTYYKSSSRTTRTVINNLSQGRVIYNSYVNTSVAGTAPGQNTSITAAWYNNR